MAAPLSILCIASYYKGHAFLRGHGWSAGGGYQPGQGNYGALQGWNAAGVYQKAIAIIGAEIDGN